jgi:hypothetical protein
VTVTIERAGQKQDITLNIAQVAAQATKDIESDLNGAPPGGPANGAPPQPQSSVPNTSNETSNE